MAYLNTIALLGRFFDFLKNIFINIYKVIKMEYYGIRKKYFSVERRIFDDK